jgi:serine/threonine-protein kinase
MPVPPNTRIGRYQIDRLIGKGGMGEVYLAQDTSLKRDVAIKLLPSDRTQDREWMRRFEREAHTASQLNHPNILTIHEIGAEDGYRFIVSEYIRGESLRQRLARVHMGLQEMLDVAMQVGSALAAAHQAGIVHRDIKPENIMLREDGYAKVLDFGLAKLVGMSPAEQWAESHRNERTCTLNDTSQGVVVGTAAYMSPEQARGIGVDGRSDIWSLGVVLYEMAAGSTPFEGQTRNDVIAAILKSAPSPLSQCSPGVPGELERIVSKALRKDAAERYQCVKELLGELARVAKDNEAAPEQGAPVPHRPPPASAGNREQAPPQSSGAASSNGARVYTFLTSGAQRMAGNIRGHRVGNAFLLSTILLVCAYLFFYIDPFSPRAQSLNSIAVLPFADGDRDEAVGYLSEGISESLIDRLSRLKEVKVTARSSSFKFRGKDLDVWEVARSLGVEAILTGEVSLENDDLLVRADLVDARDKTHLWGGHYRRKVEDVQAIQDDISLAVTNALRLRLTGPEQERVSNQRRDNKEAYQLYLKGRYFWNKLTREALEKSITYFNQALEKDPDFSLAHAGLANAYVTLGANDVPPAETYPKAIASARKAIELDESLAEAHYAAAVAKLFYEWELPGAEKELTRTLELNPSYAAAHSLLGHLRIAQGRAGEAIPLLKRALEIDPFSLLFNTNLAYAYSYARQHGKAAEQLQKTLVQEPDASFLYSDLCVFNAQLGKYEEALAACQKATILAGDEPWALSSLGIAYALSGKRSEAQWVADNLNSAARKKYVQPYQVAAVYAALGEKSKALAWLDKALAERSPSLVQLSADPVFDKLRSDPRYIALLRAIRPGP